MNAPRKIVIFGTNTIAACALSFFREDKIADVVAFTLDSRNLVSNEFYGLPVIPYEDISTKFSSEEYQIFVAVGYSDINRNREKVMNRVRSDGYRLASCISPRATIMPGTTIGSNAFIFHGCTIDPYAEIGEGVLIGSNTVIGHHSIIEDYCYLPYATVVSGSAKIGHHSIVGCNATIGASVAIGPYNIIGDGAVICGSTEEGCVYIPSRTPKGPMNSERIKEFMLKPITVRSEKHR